MAVIIPKDNEMLMKLGSLMPNQLMPPIISEDGNALLNSITATKNIPEVARMTYFQASDWIHSLIPP
jgi:hypothetical protein